MDKSDWLSLEQRNVFAELTRLDGIKLFVNPRQVIKFEPVGGETFLIYVSGNDVLQDIVREDVQTVCRVLNQAWGCSNGLW